MSFENLIIGGIAIPAHALSDGFSQDYDEIAGIGDLTMGDGSIVTQRAWPDAGRNYLLLTTLSGAGSLPLPLDGLNRASHYEIECAQHRHVAGVTNVLTLPAGRRSGGIYAPQGYAVVLVGGAYELVPVAFTNITGNAYTLATVTGAQHYEVRYWPKFTGRIIHKSTSEPWRARRGWTLTMREVL